MEPSRGFTPFPGSACRDDCIPNIYQHNVTMVTEGGFPRYVGTGRKVLGVDTETRERFDKDLTGAGWVVMRGLEITGTRSRSVWLISSFVAEGLGGENAGGGPGGVEGRDERDAYGDQSNENAVQDARSEGNVVDGVHLGSEREQAVVASDVREGVAED